MMTPEPTTTATHNDAEQCLPTETLKVDGVPPEVGDDVEFTVRGKVTRVEGTETYVTATEINGQPVPEKPSEPAGDDDMMKLAAEADAAQP